MKLEKQEKTKNKTKKKIPIIFGKLNNIEITNENIKRVIASAELEGYDFYCDVLCGIDRMLRKGKVGWYKGRTGPCNISISFSIDDLKQRGIIKMVKIKK